jgi:hypothetical protein
VWFQSEFSGQFPSEVKQLFFFFHTSLVDALDTMPLDEQEVPIVVYNKLNQNLQA